MLPAMSPMVGWQGRKVEFVLGEIYVLYGGVNVLF